MAFNREVVVHKVWRSEIKLLIMFALLSVVSIALSHQFPGSVIRGDLIPLGSVSVVLALPLFWFLPAGVLIVAIARIYDVRYVIDKRGIQARVGILSLHQRITRVRFEDVRSVEIEQSLVERLLNVGNVEVSTAATGLTEIDFRGVAAPAEVQEMINRERDQRLRMHRKLQSASPERSPEGAEASNVPQPE